MKSTIYLLLFFVFFCNLGSCNIILQRYRFLSQNLDDMYGNPCITRLALSFENTLNNSNIFTSYSNISSSGFYLITKYGLVSTYYVDWIVGPGWAPSRFNASVTDNISTLNFVIDRPVYCNPLPPQIRLTYQSSISNFFNYHFYYKTDFNMSKIESGTIYPTCNSTSNYFSVYVDFVGQKVILSPSLTTGTGLLKSFQLNCLLNYSSILYPFQFNISNIFSDIDSQLITPSFNICTSTTPSLPGISKISTMFVTVNSNQSYQNPIVFNGYTFKNTYVYGTTGSQVFQYQTSTSNSLVTAYAVTTTGLLNLGSNTISFIQTNVFPDFYTYPSEDAIFTNITNVVYNMSISYNRMVNGWDSARMYGALYADLQYPYGYKRINPNTFYLYTISYTNMKGIDILRPYVYCFGSTRVLGVVNYFSKTDTTYPVLQSAFARVISPSLYMYTINVTDEGTGLNCIQVSGDGYRNATVWLISGNSMNGVYQFTTSLYRPTLYLYDYASNQSPTIYPNYVNTYLDYISYEKSFSYDLKIEQFTYFQFIPNVIDTSFGATNVTLLFNVSNANVDYTPKFVISFPIDSYQFTKYYGYWDYTDQVYRVDFTIPPRMYNATLQYSFGQINSDDAFIDYPFFVDKFGDSAKLQVWSNFTDALSPHLDSIIWYSSDPLSFHFNLTVVDYVNGFNFGYIEVITANDPLPYNFTFSSAQRVSGDIYYGVYQFTVNLTVCISQQFRVQKIYLQDNGGYIAMYVPEAQENVVSPILEPFSSLVYSFTCASPIPLDRMPPFISDLNLITKSVNVRSNDRSIRVELQITDTGVGLSSRHDPVLYLNDFNHLTLKVVHSQRTDLSDLIRNYTYTYIVPYGYSADSPIAISVYGLVDNHYNIGGYSAMDLKQGLLSYYINTTSTFGIPVIESSSRVYQHGGNITLYGFQFVGINPPVMKVDYGDGKGYVLAQVIQPTYSIVLYAKLTNTKISGPSIKVQLSSNGVLSNEFIIPITPYSKSILNPPVTPVSCLNGCSGNGQCTENGCQCVSPYSGPDCSVKNQQVDPPKPNPEVPRVELSNQHIVTNISVYGIRELDISGNQVVFHPLQKWYFNNNTMNTSTTSTNYQYTTLFNNNQTNITTTVQWFTEPTIINYAYENVTIPPFTVKYSVTLNKYQFQSNLNTLQVVMQVDLSESTGGKCISQSYGSGQGDLNDIQWLKIRVEDKSFYGQFIRKGVIDGKVITIKNSKLPNSIIPSSNLNTSGSSGNGAGAFIGINIPSYQQSILIDPYFSYLIESDSQDNSDQCNASDSSKTLTKEQLIGIIVGSAACALIISLVSIYFIRKKYRLSFSNKSIKLVKRY